MKKRLSKILAVVLVIGCVLSTIGVVPAVPVTAAEDKKDNRVQVSDITVGGENIEAKKVKDGVRVTFSRKAQGWQRARTNGIYDTRGEGTTVELTDIVSLDDDYSMVVWFGEEAGYYDKPGICLVYGKSGYFAIISTDGVLIDPNKSPVLAQDVREPLNGSLSINVKLDDSKYIITANGKSYTISSAAISAPDGISFTFGSFGDGMIQGLNYNRSFKKSAFSFTIAGISQPYEGAGYEPIGDTVTGTSVGMGMPQNVEFRKGEEGVQIAFLTEAAGWSRVAFNGTFPINESGLHIPISKIYSAEDNYSFVMNMTNVSGGWYDKAGYMLVYGKGGDFAIIGNDGVTVDVNKAAVIKQEKREALDSKLDLRIALKGNNYEITANGKTYTFAVDSKYLSDPANVRIGFSFFCDGRAQNLNYNKSYKKAAASFVIDQLFYDGEPISTRLIKPLAKYAAIMTGATKDKFEPEAPLTRGEAIVATAKMLTNKADIDGIFTCDFTDLKANDKNYSWYAFMQRSDFLPNFGEKLEPKKEITRGEFVDLLLNQFDVETGLTMGDVDAANELYGKICYAINHGVFELDASGNFNLEATVTRGEAAKVFCMYLGKTGSVDKAENVYKDVKKDSANYEYIMLACNKQSYQTKKYSAKTAEDVQKYINEAKELAKTADTKVTITLSEDVYQLSQPIAVEQSGNSEYELVIVIKNAEGVKPTLSSNIDLNASDFKKVNGEEYYSYQIPESAKVHGAYPQFRDLYLDGERLTIAKGREYIFEETVPTTKIDENKNSYENLFFVDSSALEGITAENVGTLEMGVNLQWTSRIYPIQSFNGTDEKTGLSTLKLTDEAWAAYLKFDGNKEPFTGWTYWFENHIALLDEPGEFYYDDAAGIVYLYPYKDTDMKKATVSYPALEMLVTLKEAKNITFEGITFTGITSNYTTNHLYNGMLGGINGVYTDGQSLYENVNVAAIYADGNTDFITVKNCTFDELGANGIYMKKANRNSVIKGNSFTDLAMSGVVLGTQSTVWTLEDGQSNIVIDNNYIYNIGTDYKNAPGIYVTRVKNLAVTHNSMIHTPYSGLMVGWITLPSTAVNTTNAEIAYNHCEDNLYALNDGAGLYVCGANAMTTNQKVLNVLHHNFVKSTGNIRTYNGIYMDMNCSNFKVYKNVIEGFDNAYGPVFNQDHIVDQYTYNNTLVDNFTTVKAITTTSEPERNIILQNNKKFAKHDELPEEGLKIIESTGQKDKYAGSTAKNFTDVKMEIVDAHISIYRQGKSDKNALVFTVTNNSDKEAAYAVETTSKNTKDITVVPSTESLKLKARETGTIEVVFEGGDKMVKRELYDFVVVKDNGWKEEFRRVIEVSVSNEIAPQGVGSSPILWIGIGVAVIVVAGATATILIVNKRKKSRKGDASNVNS